jgi:hypothetical protein
MIGTWESAGRSAQDLWKSRFLGYVAMLSILSVLLWFGLYQWPGFHWDGAFFLTPILHAARGQGWTFGGYTYFLLERPTILYNFHGFLTVILFGSILRAASWQTIYLWCGVLNAAIFLVYTFLYHRALARHGHQSLILASSFGLIPAVLGIGVQGRPEHLGMLLVPIPLLILELTRRPQWALLVAYGACGLLLITSPLPGLAGFVIVAQVLLWRANHSGRWRSLFAELPVFLLLSLSLAAIVTRIFAPFNFFSWFREVALEGGEAKYFEGAVAMIYESRLGLTMIAPFWNLLIVCGFIGVVILMLERRNRIGLVLLTCSALYFNRAMADYGYVSFVPLVILAGIEYPRLRRHGALASINDQWIFRSLCLFAMVYTFVFSQYFLQSIVLQRSGHSLATERARLEKNVGAGSSSSSRASIGFPGIRTPSMIVLGNGGIDYIDLDYPQISGSSVEALSRYERKFGRQLKYFVLPMMPFTSLKDVPASILLDGKRFDRVYGSETATRSALASFVILDRVQPAYHHALYRLSNS